MRYLFIFPFQFSAMCFLLLLLFVSGVIYFFHYLCAHILFHTFLRFAMCVLFLCTLVSLLGIFGRTRIKNSSHHRRRRQHCFVYFRYDGKIRWHNNFCRLVLFIGLEFSFAIHTRTPNITLSRYASTIVRATPHFWIYFYIFS